MKRVADTLGENPQFTQGVFAGVFIVGVIVVLGLKALGAPQLLVTAVPILLMSGYAGLVFAPPVRLRPDQTGDNVYYLGFLFTLVSLGWSLHQFNVAAGVEEIVQNFGIAIASTIAGVFGRVVLNQMRTDPWEVERATRLALTDSAKNLRSELDNSIIEFNAYRRQIQQAAADGIRELQDIANKQLLGSTGRLEKMVNDTAERVEGVVGHWTHTAEGFNTKSSEMAEAMAKLSVRLEAVRAPADIIDEKMAPAGEAVNRLAAAADGAATHLQSALSRVEFGASELKTIVDGARDVVEFARAQGEVLARAGDVLDAAKAQVLRMDEAGGQFEAGLARSATDLSQGLLNFLDRLDVKLANARDLAEEGHKAAAEQAAEQIAAMAEQIDRLTRAPATLDGPPPPVDGVIHPLDRAGP